MLLFCAHFQFLSILLELWWLQLNTVFQVWSTAENGAITSCGPDTMLLSMETKTLLVLLEAATHSWLMLVYVYTQYSHPLVLWHCVGVHSVVKYISLARDLSMVGMSHSIFSLGEKNPVAFTVQTCQSPSHRSIRHQSKLRSMPSEIACVVELPVCNSQSSEAFPQGEVTLTGLIGQVLIQSSVSLVWQQNLSHFFHLQKNNQRNHS